MESVLKPDHKFILPTKQIKSIDDMKKWENSEAYQEYLGFIVAVGDAIKGMKIRDLAKDDLRRVDPLLTILLDLQNWVDLLPPHDQHQRFGNTAFRVWHSQLSENSLDLLDKAFPNFLKDQPEKRSEGLKELKVYFDESFGNPTRIDYGTGHEMNFMMFCICLFKMGVLDPKKDLKTVGLTVLDDYLQVVRKLQLAYRMEPAGSQGVWSLDDYQFVPFIWGAAQLVDHPKITTKSIPDYELAEMLASEYHFFSCIKNIALVKLGPFSEHSNQLWNISGVPLWSKVYIGLVKMYRKEMLGKFPVIQHTYFGSVFTLEEAKDKTVTKKLETTPTSGRGSSHMDKLTRETRASARPMTRFPGLFQSIPGPPGAPHPTQKNVP